MSIYLSIYSMHLMTSTCGFCLVSVFIITKVGFLFSPQHFFHASIHIHVGDEIFYLYVKLVSHSAPSSVSSSVSHRPKPHVNCFHTISNQIVTSQKQQSFQAMSHEDVL